MITTTKCPKCGGELFEANQHKTEKVIVNGNNDWISDLEDQECETPFGPFFCLKCEATYDNLPIIIPDPEPIPDPKPVLLRRGKTEKELHDFIIKLIDEYIAGTEKG
jgi:hypothetical protein